MGLYPLTLCLLGFDSQVHMGKRLHPLKIAEMHSVSNHLTAEETSDASRAMPRSIMWSTYANAFLGFIMVITLIFTMGDLEKIAETATGYPFIQVFYNATGSKAGTSVMTLCIILPLTGSVIACIATASRQIWSFARDQGIPFSGTIRHVSAPFPHALLK